MNLLPRRIGAIRVALAIGTLLVLVWPIGAAEGAAMPGPSNPTANVVANPPILSSGQCSGTSGSYTCANPCVTSSLTWPVWTADQGCTAYVLEAIDNARAAEGVPAMVLPSNWDSLSIAEQLFVVADLERVDRGYPAYLGMNAALTSEAQSAAAADSDPGVAAGFAVGTDAAGYEGVGGAWSGGGFNVLVADYYWMYADGWGGSAAATSNVDCTSASDPGCWGHRDELLGSDPGFNPGVGLECTTCELGAAGSVVSGHMSYVDLIELPAATPPTMTFTWAQEAPFLHSGTTTTTTSSIPSTPSSTPLGASHVHLQRTYLGANAIRVGWSDPGVQGITRVMLTYYRDRSCRGRARTASATYAPRTNTTRATLGVSAPRRFLPAATYSANVRVFVGSTSRVSACAVIGRS